jgi:adenylate cyclase
LNLVRVWRTLMGRPTSPELRVNGRPTAEMIERLFLGPDPRYTRSQVAERAGVPQRLTERIWRALGFATLADDAVAFTDADVDALRRVRSMIDEGLLDESGVIRMARALGQTTARLAQWQAEIMIGAMVKPGVQPSEDDIAQVLEAAQRLLPGFEQLLVHVWHSQLAAAGTRLLALADVHDELVPTRLTLAVGFADLVAFTRISRDLDEGELADLVEGFESRAADVVAARGARLVKTLGDEVLFTAPDAGTAAEIAIELVAEVAKVAAVRQGGAGPDVRVGLAYGPVLPLMGDVFGTTVNLAARLTAIARPGTVLADTRLAEALSGAPNLEVQRIRRRSVQGLGWVQPYVLSRPVAGTS